MTDIRDLGRGALAAAGSLALTLATTPASAWASETTERTSVSSTGEQANGDSLAAAVAADGRYVAFDSSATNLVKGDTGGGVYVRDRLKGTTERADLGPGGVPADRVSFIDANAISAGGRFVTFSS